MKSDDILTRIDSLYGKKLSYEELCFFHGIIIENFDHLLIHVSDDLPENNTRVFAVQDLSFMGKGIFIGDYWFTKEYGFVANIFDEDGYGYITKWVTFETINKELK